MKARGAILVLWHVKSMSTSVVTRNNKINILPCLVQIPGQLIKTVTYYHSLSNPERVSVKEIGHLQIRCPQSTTHPVVDLGLLKGGFCSAEECKLS